MISEPTPHVGQLLQDIGPVLVGLLAPDEIEQVSVGRHQDPGDGGALQVLLSVTVQGEESRHYLWREGQVEESSEELRKRLAGEVQDFIAESRFAWGERRAWPQAAQ
jgi:hypothetical protein